MVCPVVSRECVGCVVSRKVCVCVCVCVCVVSRKVVCSVVSRKVCVCVVSRKVCVCVVARKVQRRRLAQGKTDHPA